VAPVTPLHYLFLRLRPVLAAFAVVLALGTVGYVVLADGYGWFDGLYMTVITIGTIGYGEVHPLDTLGRVWTIFIVVLGYATFIFGSATLTSMFVSQQFRQIRSERRRHEMRQHLRDHVIVIGFGRVARAALASLARTHRARVVIEEKPELAGEIEESGAVPLVGDGRKEDVLIEAGIERASALITAVDDPSNLVVTLTARSLQPELRIVSRLNEESWRERLRRAGATTVVAVYESAGLGLATHAVGREVFAAIDLPELGVHSGEVAIGAGSPFEGRGLAELLRAVPDVLLLGVRRDEAMQRWFEIDGPLRAGDAIIAIATEQDLAALQEAVSVPATAEPASRTGLRSRHG
jgi:voltage-gated potassium channel